MGLDAAEQAASPGPFSFVCCCLNKDSIFMQSAAVLDTGAQLMLSLHLLEALPETDMVNLCCL